MSALEALDAWATEHQVEIHPHDDGGRNYTFYNGDLSYQPGPGIVTFALYIDKTWWKPPAGATVEEALEAAKARLLQCAVDAHLDLDAWEKYLDRDWGGPHDDLTFVTLREGALRAWVAELRANRALAEQAKRLVDPADPCQYDHEDYCQAHSLHKRPCPHEEIKRLAP